MKRIICLMLSALLLLGLVPALAADNWGEWKELEPGLWQRITLAPNDKGEMREQQAKGAAETELILTVDMIKGYGKNGKLSWTYTDYYLDDGETIRSTAIYNYNKKGVLTHGAITYKDEYGDPEIIWALSVKPKKDRFITQVELFDAEDTLQFRVHTTYDHDGNFISGTKFNMETKKNDEVTAPPAEDPIREEWLKKLS